MTPTNRMLYMKIKENQKNQMQKTCAYAFKKICDYIISSFSALSQSEKFAPSCVTPIQSSRPERELYITSLVKVWHQVSVLFIIWIIQTNIERTSWKLLLGKWPGTSVWNMQHVRDMASWVQNESCIVSFLSRNSI